MIPQVNKITVFHNDDLVGTLQMTPEGSNGQHATSLFYEGNPSRDLVIKAGTQIRIPKSTCEAIIEKVESVCSENLPNMVQIK